MHDYIDRYKHRWLEALCSKTMVIIKAFNFIFNEREENGNNLTFSITCMLS